MFKAQIKDLTVFKFNLFDKISNIEHFVTTREGHAPHHDPIGGFNLSYNVSDNKENVASNRNYLAKCLEITSNKLLIPQQTHSNHSKIINSESDTMSLEDTDALITSRKGLCLGAMSADCVPILVYDYKNQIAASIHAGWKGTIGHIVQNTVEKMVQVLGGETKNMIAGIGPCIGEKVYEVGDEVAEHFNYLNTADKDLVVRPHHNSTKKYLNLQMANKLQLLNSGLKEENVELANICTYSNPDMFYSARYFKNHCGRFVTGILIR